MAKYMSKLEQEDEKYEVENNNQEAMEEALI